ncbi:hypothetical protein VI817_000866 [Penicillium citrinum]|nr:hypothetical protein VI817_000866 [Penicillium citrinum]
MSSTYDLLQSKYFFSFFGQFHVADGNFPALITSPDLGSHRAPENLMSETDAENANSVLGEDLLGEFDQSIDPGDIFEGVMF